MQSMLIRCRCQVCLERRLHEAAEDRQHLRRLVLIQADEIERLRGLVYASAERIADQSELLSRRAEQ